MKYSAFFAFIFFLSSIGFAYELSLDSRPDDKVVSESKIIEMIDFIEEWSGYFYEGQSLPGVKFLKEDLIQIFAYGEQAVAQAEFNGAKLPKVNAVYESKKNMLYISDSLKADESKIETALIHELVHFMQDINGYTDSLGKDYMVCSESEAYDIQILWQMIHKVDLESVEGFQMLSFISAMRCMGSPFAK